MDKYNLENQEQFFPEDLSTSTTMDEQIYAIYGTTTASAFLDSKLTREVKRIFTSLLDGLGFIEPKYSSLKDLQDFAESQGYTVKVLGNGKIEISDSIESELSFNVSENNV